MTAVDSVFVLLFALQLLAIAWVAIRGNAIVQRGARARQSVQKATTVHGERARRIVATAQQCHASASRIGNHVHSTRAHLKIDDVPGFLITPRMLFRLGSIAFGRSRRGKGTNIPNSVPIRLLQSTGLMPPALVKLIPVWRRVRPAIRVSRQFLGGNREANRTQETADKPTNGRP